MSNHSNTQANQRDHNHKGADAAKANFDKTAEDGKQFADAAQSGLNKISDLQEQTAE